MSVRRCGVRVVALAFVAVLAATGVAVAGPAEANSTGGGPPPHVLERDMRGEEAIRTLGNRLPEVAAQNGMSAAEFRAELREDPMLWVGKTGQLLFVDDLEFGPMTHGVLDSATVPDGVEVFKLHSRTSTQSSPTTRVIVLDFDGHDARGTAWGNTTAQDTAPYDTDDSPSTFSDAERAVIYSVWQRVAEDYAPFNVDVTTEDPGWVGINRSGTGDVAFGTRVVITPSKPYNCSCGGVAYVDVYDAIGSTHDYYQPAWVFTAGVGTGAKNIAEAASHEAGHNLGLSHDGAKGTGYYQGHGDWAPIMGVGYYRPITQWSKGEYSGANQTQDDVAIINSNGAPLATDDWPTTVPLVSPVSGVIETRTDADRFSFSLTSGGRVQLAAAPATVSPNLDLKLSVTNGSGTVVANDDPSSEPSSGNDTSVGLGAAVDVTLPAGTYTVSLDGVGWGSATTTGYSDYGSLGRYRLTATITDDGSGGDGGGGGGGTPEPTPTVPAAPSGLGATTSGSTVTLTWTDNSDNETKFQFERQKYNRGRWGSSTLIDAPANATTYSQNPGSGTFRYRLRAANSVGNSAWTGWVQPPSVAKGSKG